MSKEVAAATTTSDAAAPEVPVKRGRGRPPKNPGGEKKVYVPTGRPRGRPKGSGGVKKTTTTTKTAATGRSARTPRAVAAIEEAVDKVATKATGTGRGRGRPRKSDASAAATPATKARGGPRKSNTAVTSDVADNNDELNTDGDKNVAATDDEAEDAK